MSGARSCAAALASSLGLAGCIGGTDVDQPLTFEQPETAVAYEAEVVGAPNDEIDALMRQSLGIFRRQEAGAQSIAFLRRRARDDVATAEKILRSYGWFQPTIAVEVVSLEAPAADDPAAPAAGETAAPAQEREAASLPKARAVVAIDAGPRFTLVRHGFIPLGEVNGPPLGLDAAALGSPVGGPAVAADILAAESAAVTKLRNEGRPYVEARGRDAVADLERDEIEVDTSLAPGPYYVFGAPSFEGLEDVDEAYLRTYQTWEPGEPYDARKLRDFQQALVETQLFDAVSASAPETPPEGDAAPVIVRAEEGPRRTVTAGARYDTDAGPAVRGSYEHRNLFGANETFRAEALAGLEEQNVELRYKEPQYLRPGQDFVAGFGVSHTDDDAFEEYAVKLTAGLERELSETWRVGAGGLLQASLIDDGTTEKRFLLAGLPTFADYDGSDDPLNPSEGARLNVGFTPFTGYADEGPRPLFMRLDGRGSVYQALDSEDRHILAARARLGSIVAADDEGVPASQRLYSGGGGSVRGYGERDIGPLDADGDPTGGLSVAEIGVELRSVVWGPVGAAVFAEAGTVSDAQWPDFDQGVQFAAGAGVRYLSPVGPIRLDVGVPLNPRDRDDAFQIYISIGQAY